MNRDTAITQQQLNMVDQSTPTGSLTYNQDGFNTFKDAKGRTITTPKYTATTTLTPAQQAIFDKTQGAQTNLAGLAQQQSAFLKNYLAKPFEFNDADAGKWAYNLGAKRLDPRFAREDASLRATLTNQGIREGSAAWNNAFARQGETKNDAYNQLALTGRGQAFNEALTQRNQPINEISALLGSSQIAQPNFQQTPQTGVAGVDYTGLVNSNYKAQSDASSAAMGGLFGLAAAPFAMFSDRRSKRDIIRVGTTENGLPIYQFNYIWDEYIAPPRYGFMSDDVREFLPEAVIPAGPSGYDRVDYALALEAA